MGCYIIRGSRLGLVAMSPGLHRGDCLVPSMSALHRGRKKADGRQGCDSKVPMELRGLSCSCALKTFRGSTRLRGGGDTAPRWRWRLGWETKWWERRNMRERPGLREQESVRPRTRGERPLGETQRPRERGRYKLRPPKVSRNGATAGEREERGRGKGPTESGREGRQERGEGHRRTGAGGQKPERASLPGAAEQACACGGWEPPSAAGVYSLVQGDASCPPLPTWAPAHSPSLGDEFSNKPEPEAVTSGHPSPGPQPLLNISLWPWGRYSSGCFLDWFVSQLDLCSPLCANSGPALYGLEREAPSAVPGNQGQQGTWDSSLRECMWCSPQTH